MQEYTDMKHLIHDCKCGNNALSIIYNGFYGSITCSKCNKYTKGFLNLKQLSEKWNIEHSVDSLNINDRRGLDE